MKLQTAMHSARHAAHRLTIDVGRVDHQVGEIFHNVLGADDMLPRSR